MDGRARAQRSERQQRSKWRKRVKQVRSNVCAAAAERFSIAQQMDDRADHVTSKAQSHKHLYRPNWSKAAFTLVQQKLMDSVKLPIVKILAGCPTNCLPID